MYRLLIHDSAAADLRALVASGADGRTVAARVLALVQQLNADPPLLGNLLDHGYGSGRTEEIDVSKFQEFWKQGNDLWRLKIRDLEQAGLKYRLIYAYQIQTKRFHLLAVVERDFDTYDPNSPVTRRILDDYSNL